jgi:MFS family permease
MTPSAETGDAMAARSVDHPSRHPMTAPRALLSLACIAVGFAAADTYVVVLALPDMMATVGLNLDQLQRAAPIVSGFLLGYVAMLPLIGRIADLRGRIPVLVWSLIIFALGSLVTAGSNDLVTMVIGRFLQGLGGGGLVPATLALVADIWPADKRGLPLGVVGAVQELGSVVGPLYGAIVLSVANWEAIFWLNLAAALVLAAAVLAIRPPAAPISAPGTAEAQGPFGLQIATAIQKLVVSEQRRAGWGRDLLGGALGIAAAIALALVLVEPQRLTRGLTTGLAFVPYIEDTRWTTPMAFACYMLAVAFISWELFVRHPLMDLRSLWALRRSADYLGALLLALALAGIVLAFATADPAKQVFSRIGPVALAGSAVATVLFVWRIRRAPEPLIPRGALHALPAWGSIVVSFFIGSSLIAALVDIPVFARTTTYQDSQLGAALVLVRFLAALPIGALIGGYLTRYVPLQLLALGGMVLAAIAFLFMARWDEHAVHTWPASIALVVGGLGFGLTIAPVNAALLASTESAVHGVSSAFIVVARMVGMLIGISALTTISLRRFYAVKSGLPTLHQVCHSDTLCTKYEHVLEHAGIAQLHTIFVGAAVAAFLAAVLGLVLLHPDRRRTRLEA